MFCIECKNYKYCFNWVRNHIIFKFLSRYFYFSLVTMMTRPSRKAPSSLLSATKASSARTRSSSWLKARTTGAEDRDSAAAGLQPVDCTKKGVVDTTSVEDNPTTDAGLSKLAPTGTNATSNSTVPAVACGYHQRTRTRCSPCTDPQVRRLFWCRQPADRQIRSRHVRQIRCQDVRDVLETTAQASHTRQEDGDHLG